MVIWPPWRLLALRFRSDTNIFLIYQEINVKAKQKATLLMLILWLLFYIDAVAQGNEFKQMVHNEG